MVASMQIAKAIEAFDHHGQQAEQPIDQHAIGLVVADMFQAIAVLGVVETLVLPDKGLARYLNHGSVCFQPSP
jgi:hypothetical protein